MSGCGINERDVAMMSLGGNEGGNINSLITRQGNRFAFAVKSGVSFTKSTSEIDSHGSDVKIQF